MGLPFLSDIERYLINSQRPLIFGISGLPGCGKTSFGKWLEVAAIELSWPLTVLSMDDFYLTADELNIAMYGNPWNVPRGLPGSHSIELLEECIDTWMQHGHLSAPQFDKALRNGLGDRSGWHQSQPKILVLEGWFLGCSTDEESNKLFENKSKNFASLTDREYEYRKVIQNSLAKYQVIWNRFKRIWHLKAIDFYGAADWKVQQEIKMMQERGSALNGKDLDSFIRMIQHSIPKESLQSINSDVVIKINKAREIKWVGKTEGKQRVKF